MTDSQYNSLITAATTLTSVGFGSIITYLLSKHKSNEEKLWDLRRSAYGEILSNFLEMERYLGYADQYIQEDSYRYFDSETSYKHNQSIMDLLSSSRKIFADNYIILSEDFIYEYEKFIKSLQYSFPEISDAEEHTELAKAIRTAKPNLLRQARNEMPIRKNWWKRFIHIASS